MGELRRDLLTKHIDPADLDDPGFWTVALPDLAGSNGPPTVAAWRDRLTPDFPDNPAPGGQTVSPQLTLSLPLGHSLSLQFFESDISYFLDGIDLPEHGLLGHNDCHGHLPVFRWDEVRRLAPIIQTLNPTLPQGAALLLLLPAVCIGDSEAGAASSLVADALRTLGLDTALATPPALVSPLPGIEAPMRLEYVPLRWWEASEGDWVNSSPYSLRSVTTAKGACWDEAARLRFNRALRELGAVEASASGI